jgi:HTH-type transcriptional regulator/antitoxin MqsA
MENMMHPETGEILHRDIRPIEFTYKDEKIIVEMPGWYPENNNDGIFTQEDMKVSDEALKYLKSTIKGKTA